MLCEQATCQPHFIKSRLVVSTNTFVQGHVLLYQNVMMWFGSQASIED